MQLQDSVRVQPPAPKPTVSTHEKNGITFTRIDAGVPEALRQVPYEQDGSNKGSYLGHAPPLKGTFVAGEGCFVTDIDRIGGKFVEVRRPAATCTRTDN
ncbi:hypothetical protein [Arboricoccus pini]|uniref:hypothetical protein n=1 Tax=Arboricoccus pini TaxID=1963835 RepID=UPI0010568213|nr:hypothetical protein [Arboricoccus pini]